MILVDVYGDGKEHDLIEDIANFAIDTLMPRVTNLEVEIEVGRHDTEGGCVADGRFFQIEVDSKIKGDDLITCVLHEMVHVWQHVSKKLIEKHLNRLGIDQFSPAAVVESIDLMRKQNPALARRSSALRAGLN